MSVINKMLRDLDSRGGLGPRSLEEGIRDLSAPVEAERPRPWGKISAGVIVAILAAVTGWYVLQPRKAPVPVAATNPPPAPAAKPAGPAPAVPAPPPVQVAATSPPPAPPAVAPETLKAEPAAKAVESSPAPGSKAELIAEAKVAVAKMETAAAQPIVPAKAEPAPPKVETPPPAKPAAAAKVEPPPAKVEPPPAKVETPPPAKPVAVAKVEPPPPAKPVAAAKVETPPPPKPVTVAKVEPPPAKVEAPPAKIEPVAAVATKAGPPAAAPAPAPTGEPRVSVDRGNRDLVGAPRAAAEYRSANDLLSQGKTDAALARYGDALKSDARHVAARQSLVVLLLQEGRTAEAQNVLREGIAQVPSVTSWPMLLARLQVEGGDPKGALETLERSLPQGEGSAEYRAFLATLLQMNSRHRDAIVQYEAALRIAPDSGRSLAGLAISLEREQRIPEARDAYRRAQAAGGLGRDRESFVDGKVKQLQ